METLFRSRVARIVIVGVLIVGGLWGFAPYIFKDVASTAYVNAELTQVATPVAGVLTQGLPQEGVYMSRDARLRLVTTRAPSRVRLDDLLQQVALADSTVALMEIQLAELRSQDATLASRSGLFQRASIARLAGRVREADANVARCEAQQRDLQERLTRAASLAEKGFVSEAGLRSAREAATAGDQACRASRGAGEAIQAEDAAAQRGVYLSDGSNDAPYAEQQRARLMLRRQELMTELVRAKASQAQLRGQVAAERDLYARASSYDTVLPAQHLVWSVEARPGSEVVEGQSLMTVADCRNRFVVVELPVGKIEHLSVGDAARVRLLGSGRWQDGRIRRIMGGAARRDSRLFAAEMPKLGPRNFIVEVGFESADQPDQRRSCDIGRPADVRFGGPRLGGPDSRVARSEEHERS